MKTFKKTLLVILAILPLIVTAIAVFFILPDTVAVHFGIDGSVDRRGSKYEAFILSGVFLILGVLYFLIRNIYKKKAESTGKQERTEHSLNIADTVILLLFVMFNAVNVFVLMMMHHSESVWQPESLSAVILSTIVGVVFILIGNLMPKMKRNAFIGMRMSFTMDTDEHWYIANRAGGVAMVVTGLATVAAGLITRSVSFVFWMLGAAILTLTVAIIYSYVTIKGEKKR